VKAGVALRRHLISCSGEDQRGALALLKVFASFNEDGKDFFVERR